MTAKSSFSVVSAIASRSLLAITLLLDVYIDIARCYFAFVNGLTDHPSNPTPRRFHSGHRSCI